MVKQDDDNWRVAAAVRLSGRAIGNQVVINDISTETTPDIIITDDGGFLVAWGWRDTALGGNNST